MHRIGEQDGDDLLTDERQHCIESRGCGGGTALGFRRNGCADLRGRDEGLARRLGNDNGESVTDDGVRFAQGHCEGLGFDGEFLV